MMLRETKCWMNQSTTRYLSPQCSKMRAESTEAILATNTAIFGILIMCMDVLSGVCGWWTIEDVERQQEKHSSAFEGRLGILT